MQLLVMLAHIIFGGTLLGAAILPLVADVSKLSKLSFVFRFSAGGTVITGLLLALATQNLGRVCLSATLLTVSVIVLRKISAKQAINRTIQ